MRLEWGTHNFWLLSRTGVCRFQSTKKRKRCKHTRAGNKQKNGRDKWKHKWTLWLWGETANAACACLRVIFGRLHCSTAECIKEQSGFEFSIHLRACHTFHAKNGLVLSKMRISFKLNDSSNVLGVELPLFRNSQVRSKLTELNVNNAICWALYRWLMRTDQFGIVFE